MKNFKREFMRNCNIFQFFDTELTNCTMQKIVERKSEIKTTKPLSFFLWKKAMIRVQQL